MSGWERHEGGINLCKGPRSRVLLYEDFLSGSDRLTSAQFDVDETGICLCRSLV
jgi:hypothetical protein